MVREMSHPNLRVRAKETAALVDLCRVRGAGWTGLFPKDWASLDDDARTTECGRLLYAEEPENFILPIHIAGAQTVPGRVIKDIVQFYQFRLGNDFRGLKFSLIRMETAPCIGPLRTAMRLVFDEVLISGSGNDEEDCHSTLRTANDHKMISVEDSEFLADFVLINSTILNDFVFTNTLFGNSLVIANNVFQGTLVLDNVRADDFVRVADNTFRGGVIFHNSTFRDDVHFVNNEFNLDSSERPPLYGRLITTSRKAHLHLNENEFGATLLVDDNEFQHENFNRLLDIGLPAPSEAANTFAARLQSFYLINSSIANNVRIKNNNTSRQFNIFQNTAGNLFFSTNRTGIFSLQNNQLRNVDIFQNNFLSHIVVQSNSVTENLWLIDDRLTIRPDDAAKPDAGRGVFVRSNKVGGEISVEPAQIHSLRDRLDFGGNRTGGNFHFSLPPIRDDGVRGEAAIAQRIVCGPLSENGEVYHQWREAAAREQVELTAALESLRNAVVWRGEVDLSGAHVGNQLRLSLASNTLCPGLNAGADDPRRYEFGLAGQPFWGGFLADGRARPSDDACPELNAVKRPNPQITVDLTLTTMEFLHWNLPLHGCAFRWQGEGVAYSNWGDRNWCNSSDVECNRVDALKQWIYLEHNPGGGNNNGRLPLANSDTLTPKNLLYLSDYLRNRGEITGSRRALEDAKRLNYATPIWNGTSLATAFAQFDQGLLAGGKALFDTIFSAALWVGGYGAAPERALYFTLGLCALGYLIYLLTWVYHAPEWRWQHASRRRMAFDHWLAVLARAVNGPKRQHRSDTANPERPFEVPPSPRLDLRERPSGGYTFDTQTIGALDPQPAGTAASATLPASAPLQAPSWLVAVGRWLLGWAFATAKLLRAMVSLPVYRWPAFLALAWRWQFRLHRARSNENFSERPGFLKYDSGKRPQHFNLGTYSFDTVVPVVDLHAYSTYYPASNWVRFFSHIQHFMGWILLTIFIASATIL